jgi:hypothetical protein
MRAGQKQVVVNENGCAYGEIVLVEDLDGVFLHDYPLFKTLRRMMR